MADAAAALIAELETRVARLAPHARLTWVHSFSSRHLIVHADPIDVTDARLARIGVEVSF